MNQYRNIFMEKSDAELRVLYGQYMNWESEGVISDTSKELEEIRDEYLDIFQAHTLPMVERDLLRAIAVRWYQG